MNVWVENNYTIYVCSIGGEHLPEKSGHTINEVQIFLRLSHCTVDWEVEWVPKVFMGNKCFDGISCVVIV